jgi:tetrahedral aminopeptidase
MNTQAAAGAARRATIEWLMRTPGVSGREQPLAAALAERWSRHADRVSRTADGSLHARLKGAGPAPRRSVLLSAHLDAIGFLVAAIDGPGLRLSPAGGVDPRVLPGQPVVIHGRERLPGLIIPPAGGPGQDNRLAEIRDLWVDTGLEEAELQRLVRPGDAVTFGIEPAWLGEELIAGPALDNRISLLALTEILERLSAGRPAWDVIFLAAAQEELGAWGAKTAAEALAPDLAIVLDATYGSGPTQPAQATFPLGGGPSNGRGPEIHPAMHQALRQTALGLGYDLPVEPMPVSSGTEALRIQLSGRGVPLGILSIPVRNMHTPVEVADLRDVGQTVDIVAALAAGLDEAFYASLFEA